MKKVSVTKSSTNKVNVSIGIFAHNEEKNIDRLMKSVLKQKLNNVSIIEIVVISSGSFDKTNRIVRKYISSNSNIRLLDDVQRKGKSEAINQFLKIAKSEVVITISADLRLHPSAVEEIGLPFLNNDVGMVGARPKPSNIRSSDIGEEIDLLWELHHRISLIRAKCGEMVAFRNVIRKIPHDSSVDEATIEVLLTIVGYSIVYAPRSLVYNKGPASVREYLTQRRRVYAGHQWVERKFNYKVVTMQSDQIIRVVLVFLLTNPHRLSSMFKLMYFELAARILGWIDFNVFDKNPYVWRMISR